MRRKPTLKQRLEKQANGLWILASIRKWGKFCYCGTSFISIHHFIPKSRCLALKFDVDNGCPICRACHWVIHSSPDTLKRREVEDRIIDKRGPDWLAYITEQSKVKGLKKNTMWLEGQIKKLERSWWAI